MNIKKSISKQDSELCTYTSSWLGSKFKGDKYSRKVNHVMVSGKKLKLHCIFDPVKVEMQSNQILNSKHFYLSSDHQSIIASSMRKISMYRILNWSASQFNFDWIENAINFDNPPPKFFSLKVSVMSENVFRSEMFIHFLLSSIKR